MTADSTASPPLILPPGLLSLVIPAYNEAACLEENLRTVLDYCDAKGWAVELLVVDDGSTDGTAAIVQRIADVDGRVRPLANPRNQGKGAAVRRGMLAATGDPVAFFDADLSVDVTGLPGLLQALADGADVAIGSRRVAEAEIATHQPWLRETLGRGFTWLSRVWLGVPLADFTCGFKGFRAHAVRPLMERQRLDDWSFDAELCFLATRLHLRIRQVPVVWHDMPNSKVRVGNALWSAILGLWRIRWWAVTGSYRL